MDTLYREAVVEMGRSEVLISTMFTAIYFTRSKRLPGIAAVLEANEGAAKTVTTPFILEAQRRAGQ